MILRTEKLEHVKNFIEQNKHVKINKKRLHQPTSSQVYRANIITNLLINDPQQNTSNNFYDNSKQEKSFNNTFYCSSFKQKSRADHSRKHKSIYEKDINQNITSGKHFFDQCLNQNRFTTVHEGSKTNPIKYHSLLNAINSERKTDYIKFNTNYILESIDQVKQKTKESLLHQFKAKFSPKKFLPISLKKVNKILEKHDLVNSINAEQKSNEQIFLRKKKKIDLKTLNITSANLQVSKDDTLWSLNSPKDNSEKKNIFENTFKNKKRLINRYKRKNYSNFNLEDEFDEDDFLNKSIQMEQDNIAKLLKKSQDKLQAYPEISGRKIQFKIHKK